MKKKTIFGGVIVTGLVASMGVAWATLSGILVVPDAISGAVQGNGASSCQTAAVTFTVPDPTFSVSSQDYVVSTIDYSGISTSCVQLGSADLLLNLTLGNSGLTSGQISNLTASSGTINLEAEVPFSDVTSARFNYLVRDN